MIAADLSPELSTENVENWVEKWFCTKLVHFWFGCAASGRAPLLLTRVTLVVIKRIEVKKCR